MDREAGRLKVENKLIFSVSIPLISYIGKYTYLCKLYTKS